MFFGREVRETVRALFDAIEAKDGATVANLLSAGASVDARGPEGDTPLIAAVAGGERELVELLLAAGADPNATDDEGNPPLAYALLHQDPGLAQRLLDAGSSSGASPGLLTCAAAHACPEIVRAMLAGGADPTQREGQSRSPLLAACAAGHLEAAYMLLDAGGDPKERDADGTTSLLALLDGVARERAVADTAPLRARGYHGSEGLQTLVNEVVAATTHLDDLDPRVLELELPSSFRDVFQLLLDGGVSLDAVDEIGRNAIAIAVADGYPRWVIEALLVRGANPLTTDEDGLSALDFAGSHPDHGVRRLLGR